jgi:cathepsin X
MMVMELGGGTRAFHSDYIHASQTSFLQRLLLLSLSDAHPSSYLAEDDIPDNWNWDDVNGKSYLTKLLNQHIPHYCGSCWAHGAISALQDRIKIARKGEGHDINLSIQYLLNCGAGTAGSCHGGYHTGVYELIQKTGFIPFET